MKKGLLMTLCLLLALLPVASGLAATTFTLPEKMDKQLSIGSGLKGSFQLSAEGTDPLVLTLSPMLDVPMQIRGMKAEEQWHYYIYQAGENESQIGLTEAFYDGQKYYLRSDLLPEQVLSLPGLPEMLDQVTGREDGNPAFASMLLRYFTMSAQDREERWKPFLDRLTQRMELWLAPFAVTGSKESRENQAEIEQTYTIPMAEMQKEIIALVKEIQNDADAAALFDTLLNAAQKKIYLNGNLDYFYREAMDALDEEFDVTLTRTFSTMGGEIASTIELPLDRERFGYTSLTIHNSKEETEIQLKNDLETLTIETEDDLTAGEFTGMTVWISRVPTAEATGTKGIALRAELRKTSETYSDEETRDHLRDHWSLKVESDFSRLEEDMGDAVFENIAPITGELDLHYSSKYSQSSPTTLDIEASWKQENLQLSLKGQLKTASPWIFAPFDTQGAKDFLSLSAEEKALCLAEWLASAGEQLKKADELAQTAAPEATPTAAPEAENSEAKPEETAAEETPAAEAPAETETEPGTDAEKPAEEAAQAGEETAEPAAESEEAATEGEMVEAAEAAEPTADVTETETEAPETADDGAEAAEAAETEAQDPAADGAGTEETTETDAQDLADESEENGGAAA